jgi:hypothetical protein
MLNNLTHNVDFGQHMLVIKRIQSYWGKVGAKTGFQAKTLTRGNHIMQIHAERERERTIFFFKQKIKIKI